ncbi:WAG22 antigen-like [Pecten maximus]|uniref:WAG22 antigen-like n=1 Tax=Pecten maximus TaxID=6579 RepID=UPI0014591021|nr:WAG22 antigen-like [Pecten maximus]
MKRYLWMLLALPVMWAQTQLQAPPNCIQPAKPGSCLAAITNYFYNTTSGQCETFLFGGCGGNDNRFQSKEDCERRCSCHMPPGPGPCRASMERWYYNEKKGCCERFTFGGCKPNGNNFESKRACEKTCNWSFSGKQKPLGIEWGSGYDRRLGEIVYKNYGTTYGGSGTIWLHNEIESMKSAPTVGSQIMGIIKRTGRRQVPGVQTKQQFQIMMGGGQGSGQGQVGSGGMNIGGISGMTSSGGGGGMLTSGGRGGMMSSGGRGRMMSTGGGDDMMGSGGAGGMMSGGMMSSGGAGGMMTSSGGGGMMPSGGSGGMMSSGGSGGMMSSGGGGGMMRSGGGGGMMPSGGSGGMMSSGGGGGMMRSGGGGGMMSSGGSGGMMPSGGSGGMMGSGGGGGMMSSGGGGRWQTGGGQGAGLGPGITNIQV